MFYWRCAHRSGNQRHVFQTWVTLAQRPSHAVVPNLSGPSLDNPGFGRFPRPDETLDLHLEHGGFDIARQHNVAAAAQHKNGAWLSAGSLRACNRSATSRMRTRFNARAAIPKVFQGCKGTFFSTTIATIVALGPALAIFPYCFLARESPLCHP